MRKLAGKAGGRLDLVLDEIAVDVVVGELPDFNGSAVEPA
jgi:hypothetical protein